MSTDQTDQTTSDDHGTSETPQSSDHDNDDKAETPQSSDHDNYDKAETPELSDEGKEQVKDMTQAYDDDRPTAVLPGTDGTITGVAINEWLDDDGNPKFGKDEQKDRDEQKSKDEHDDEQPSDDEREDAGKQHEDAG